MLPSLFLQNPDIVNQASSHSWYSITILIICTLLLVAWLYGVFKYNIDFKISILSGIVIVTVLLSTLIFSFKDNVLEATTNNNLITLESHFIEITLMDGTTQKINPDFIVGIKELPDKTIANTLLWLSNSPEPLFIQNSEEEILKTQRR